MERKIDILRQHCKDVGRNFTEITLATTVADPTFKGRHFSPEFIGYIEACIRLGARILSIRFFRLKDKALEAQERFADEIIPSFKV
jgi:hypothetical protein